ncbi:Prefoldin subunit alpha [Candidatus Tiddalikarchaeum anstoanum]|nr:Prefoldin subunit alpha [Candidatus Tiddalikarchaeum anstoanum]
MTLAIENLRKTLNEKGYEFETMRREVAALDEELGQVSERISSFENAKLSLTTFKNTKENDELIVPVGEGVFIKTKLMKNDEVMIGVGSNVVLTKDIDSAIAYIDARIDEADNIIQTLNNNLAYFNQRLMQLENEIQQIMNVLKSEESKGQK